jgi:hypothetical protein
VEPPPDPVFQFFRHLLQRGALLRRELLHGLVRHCDHCYRLAPPTVGQPHRGLNTVAQRDGTALAEESLVAAHHGMKNSTTAAPIVTHGGADVRRQT